MVGVGLALVAGLLWFQVVASPDGRLHLLVLDVGQGDSIFIVTPKGRQVLIDGGPERLSGVRALGRHMAFWDRSLDMVVLTHSDEDHLAGLPGLLESYRVGTLLESPSEANSAAYNHWRKVISRQNLEPIQAQRGQRIVVDRGVWLDVLNPPPTKSAPMSWSANNNSVVIRLTYGEVSFLLAADIEAEAEDDIIGSGVPLNSDVLKVAHHGSKTSTAGPFLAAVSPRAAVISMGAENSYGHPHKTVLDRLGAQVGEDQVYLTTQQGTVEFITDGHRLWVRPQR